jgi:hypothetical protein
MPIARQQLGKHFPEVTLSTTEGNPRRSTKENKGVQRSTKEYEGVQRSSGVQLEVRIVPVECPVGRR